MSKTGDMTPSEHYICDLFYDRYGILLEKINELHGSQGQTPDFECMEDGERTFVCELKDFEIILPSEETGWEIEYYQDGSMEATRNSNAINRISRTIYSAYKQLKRFSEPKILVFLNWGANLDVRDLEETFRGYFPFAEVGDVQYINTDAKRASEGIIKEIKWKIDLYVWIDAARNRPTLQQDQIFFRSVTDNGRMLVRKYFKLG